MKNKKITKSIYGSVALLKGSCNFCKEKSFIIDGMFQCCNRSIDDDYKIEIKKREVEGEFKRSLISSKLKQEILDEQDNRCIYCNLQFNTTVWDIKRSKYRKLKTHFDHFVAWVYSRDNHKSNIIASCDICNSIKSDKHFHDVISAREFIITRRKEKGY